MAMAPDSWKGLYENTLAQARSGEIPMARLDDAVRRILRVKVTARPVRRRRARGKGKAGVIGAPEHRALAREAVRKSLVLLKNNGGVLPIKPSAQGAGRRCRRRRHRPAVRRLDAVLAGHGIPNARFSERADRSSKACAEAIDAGGGHARR